MINPAYLPVLVTGASGNLGRLILNELLDVWQVPADQIIATTRAPDSLADYARRGVIVREADFNRPETLVKAFAGARRMLIISTSPSMPYVDGERFIQQTAAINAGIEAGVEHIMYTSAPNPEPGTPCFWKADHYKTELALINSGVTWTILRHWEWPDWHLQENWMKSVASGEFFSCTGAGRANHISREDCAAADAGALLSDFTLNRRFDVTGPDSYSAEEIMAILSEVTGKPIKVTPCTPAQYPEKLAANGVNPEWIPVLDAYAEAMKRGLYGGTTDAMEELCGRKPHSLRHFFESKLNTKN